MRKMKVITLFFTKCLFLAAMLTMAQTARAQGSAAEWTQGSGTATAPYIISTKEQLDLLAHRVNGTHGQTRQADGFKDKYFKLGADIEYDPSELIFDNDGNRKCVYGLQGFPRRLVHPQRRAARRQAHEERDLHE